MGIRKTKFKIHWGIQQYPHLPTTTQSGSRDEQLPG
jgi:hypothetical protein